MSENESLLREVDQNLAEDKLWTDISRNLPLLIAAAAAVVIGVGGWQFYNYKKTETAEDAAREFRAAVQVLAENPADGVEALAAFVESAPAGYRTVAGLKLAAAYSASGDDSRALDAYRRIYADDGAEKRVRDVARLRAAYLALRDGPAAVMTDIGGLAEDASPLGYFAKEIVGLAQLRGGDYAAAETTFRALSLSLEAPASLRDRATEFRALASAGKSGVVLSWPAEADPVTIDDYFESLKGDGEGLGKFLEEGAAVDDGHDHSAHDAIDSDTASEPEDAAAGAPAEEQSPDTGGVE